MNRRGEDAPCDIFLFTPVLYGFLALSARTINTSNARRDTVRPLPKTSARIWPLKSVPEKDATLLELPDGKNMLVDCGPSSSSDDLVDYLNDQGVETIDWST